jgi:hypothetical protein
MRNYDAALVTEIAKEAAAGHWLVSIGLATPLYYTDCDISLPYGGYLYLSRGLRVLEIQQTSGFSVDAAKLELDDTDRALITALLSEDAADKTVVLYFTVLNAASRSIATSEITRGTITSWEAPMQKVQLSLGSEFRLWKKKPLRLPTPNCPWSFLGTECGYTGAETWCDQSPERCSILANYSNFGGRKFIAAVEDQKIYWGSK